MTDLVVAPSTAVERFDDAAWRLWRSAGLGGSDVPILLGLSSYGSPVSLYYEKLGLTDPPPESQRQRLGKRMEQVLALEFHDETGLHVVGEQTWCEHPVFPWARCTVDGFAADGPSLIGGPEFQPHGVVEFKTDGRFAWPDGIPPNIRAQVVWQMGVTGFHHAWIVVMFAGFKVEVFEVPWDDDAVADWDYLLAAGHRFWTQNVQAGIVPPMDDHPATTAALSEVHADAERDTYLDADDQARELAARLRVAKIVAAQSASTADRLENEMRSLLGEHTDLIDGWTPPAPRSKKGPKPNVLASWRPQGDTRTNWKAIAPHVPAELIAEHTTTKTIRVLRVPKLKET